MLLLPPHKSVISLPKLPPQTPLFRAFIGFYGLKPPNISIFHPLITHVVVFFVAFKPPIYSYSSTSQNPQSQLDRHC